MKDERDLSDRSLSSQTDSPRNNVSGPGVEEELLSLARILREMPTREPPRDLTEAVLQSVTPKEITAWRRLVLWLITPHRITVSPLRLIPVTAVVIALTLFVIMNFLPKQESPLGLHRGQKKLVSVSFTFQHQPAHSVSLIGSFNQWNPVGFEMRQKGKENFWSLELMLPVGRHKYAFLVDGQFIMSDPNTPFSEEDGFGNVNSIIFVTNDHENII
jgi:hypothetical protein